jgi:hypothetical protein
MLDNATLDLCANICNSIKRTQTYTLTIICLKFDFLSYLERFELAESLLGAIVLAI